MKRIITILLALSTAAGIFDAAAQMTDRQISRYVTTALQQGKSETQIASELASRGVSESQVRQLMQAYGLSSGNSQSGGKGAALIDESSRSRSRAEAKADPVKQAPGTKAKAAAAKKNAASAGESLSENGKEEPREYEELYDKDGEKRIYGHDIFSAGNLSFEPNQNAATPENYVLGPGDEVIIDIWGATEVTIRQKIAPEGTLNISRVGPVALSGLTIAEAKGKLKSVLKKTYSSLSGGASQMAVTLGEVRTIQVNVMGEVNAPGTYRLSSFSTVFSAIYQAGGITSIGSLRDVRISRGGEGVLSVDVYEFIFGGKAASNVPLKEGDVIVVPAYGALVGVTGHVKRPMFYEARAGEPLKAMIDYAGGFSGNAWAKEVQVERKDSKSSRIYTVPEKEFGRFSLADGDMIIASGNEIDHFTNRISVKGAVYRPGKFELGGDIITVGQLIEHAGGLLPEAFTGRAQLLREKEDRSLEILAVPVGAIVGGLAEDIVLRPNDELIIADKNEMEPKGDLVITGEVINPGSYKFAENTSVEDLIFLAGGLTEGASSARVDVSRRIGDPGATSAGSTLAEVFTLSISNGLVEGKSGGFRLQPNDIVSVRKSPSYVEQRNVTISGEVTFPGQYTLVSTSERVSEVFKRAGGVTPNGNIKGAIIKRRINPYERNLRNEIARLATQTASDKDSLETEKLQLDEMYYNVGLELDKALKNPGGTYDLVLRDGDELIVPELSSTVRIQGEVLYPNTVQYIKGKPVSYYIKQAGGYGSRARKSKVYVVYMNGTAAVGKNARLEPGCEIIVPSKPEQEKMSASEKIALSTAIASFGSVIATILHLIL